MEKRIFIFPVLALFLLFSCTEEVDTAVNMEPLPTPVNQVATGNLQMVTVAKAPAITTMALSEDTYDFGKMKIGGKYAYKFVLTNTGKEPLQIESVKGTCTCIAFDWTKTAIAPGECGFVVGEYKPKAGKTGRFVKTLTVRTNTEPPVWVLKFTGEVFDSALGKDLPR